MRSAVILTIALLAACSTLAPEPRTPQPLERAVTAFEPAAADVQSLLLAARTASAEQGNTYRLQAAEHLARNGQRITSLLEEININAASQQQLRRYLMLRAQDALNGTDPAMALRWLGDSRLTQILLDRSAQVELGLLKAATYAAMRSYLASARERIYIHSLLTLDDQVENTEAIFRILQELPAKALRRSAERELTSEVRGWLSLAELAQRHADGQSPSGLKPTEVTCNVARSNRSPTHSHRAAAPAARRPRTLWPSRQRRHCRGPLPCDQRAA